MHRVMIRLKNDVDSSSDYNQFTELALTMARNNNDRASQGSLCYNFVFLPVALEKIEVEHIPGCDLHISAGWRDKLEAPVLITLLTNVGRLVHVDRVPFALQRRSVSKDVQIGGDHRAVGVALLLQTDGPVEER